MVPGRFFPLARTACTLLIFAFFHLGDGFAADDLPNSPQPQNSSSQQTPQPAASGQNAPNTQAGQNGQTHTETEEERKERAQRELQEQEKQRMLGVVPMFNVTSNADAAPLTPKQKFQLFFKSSTDWYQFVITAIDGGISMAGDEYPSYGQGVEGFAKYWGAAYTDTFDGNFWGNAVLPSWWHEDPRYYRMGHGKFFKRMAYAAVTTVWCRRDSGKWGPNYANVTGNFIGGAISNIYYPSNQRGVGLTLGRGASVTYEGIVGAEIAEFWPDIGQRLAKRHAEKLAKKRAREMNAPDDSN
ncbi:MAG: hypothetical protein WA399_05895 [Acidobacteriaceae bacterium]